MIKLKFETNFQNYYFDMNYYLFGKILSTELLFGLNYYMDLKSRNQDELNFLLISVSCLFTKHVCGPSFVPVQDTVMLGLSTRLS